MTDKTFEEESGFIGIATYNKQDYGVLGFSKLGKKDWLYVENPMGNTQELSFNRCSIKWFDKELNIE